MWKCANWQSDYLKGVFHFHICKLKLKPLHFLVIQYMMNKFIMILF
jgi:hypothetical protein